MLRVPNTAGPDGQLTDEIPGSRTESMSLATRNSRTKFQAFALSGAAISVLLTAHAVGVGLDTLHIMGMSSTFNDQVIYVDAARHLLATGELTTGMIYPSTLLQEYGRNFFYMPGHAVVLALSMGLLGDSAASAMLPSLLAHLVCLGCLFLLGRRLVDTRAGVFAAASFALTPIFIVYAFSAMAEMTTLATCLVALTAFVHLPRRVRPWAAPFLLLVPFLFRETTAFWIAPMVVLLLVDEKASRVERWRGALVASFGSVIGLGIVYRLDWIADRPSLWAQNLFGRSFHDKYTDAYSISGLDVDATMISSAIADLAIANLGGFLALLATPSFEAVVFHGLVWLPIGAAWLAWRSRPLRPLVMAWALLAVITFVFATLFYRWNFFIGIRQLLPPMALGLLVLGAALADLTRGWRPRFVMIPACAAWLVSCALVIAQTSVVIGRDDLERKIRDVLRRTTVPDTGLFIAHHNIGLVRLLDTPLSSVAFPPTNRATLELLADRYDLRSALLREHDVQRLKPAAIGAVGLEEVGSIMGNRFFRRRHSATQGRADRP
jgi:4-amino-4-deoxy-L-arabinose transferase-like glycosyltransferase